MDNKEKLKQEIEEAKAKLKELEELEKTSERDQAIKKLKDYTDKEKIDFFDKLYKNAKYELKELEKNGYSDEDNASYAWETYIVILAKDQNKFWKYWNSFD